MVVKNGPMEIRNIIGQWALDQHFLQGISRIVYRFR